MNGQVDFRDEPADGPAARALFDEYIALVQRRLGLEFVPSERIFATEDAFAAEGAAWLMIYDGDGMPIGCGGLRVLDAAAGIGEIKRMFLTARGRGRGLGRRLLRELEARALQAGLSRVRLLTTDVLSEARALYAAEGYELLERIEHEDEPAEIWLEKHLDE